MPTFDEMRSVLADNAQYEKLRLGVLQAEKTTNLDSGLGIDSPALLEFEMALEDKYDIDLSNCDMARCQTLGDLHRLVEKVLEQKAA